MTNPLDVLDALCASLCTEKATAPAAPGRDAARAAMRSSRAVSAVRPDETPGWEQVGDDPLEALDALCASLAVKQVPFPGVLVAVPGRDAVQVVERKEISRFSRFSRQGEDEAGQDKRPDTVDAKSPATGSRARGLLHQMPGKPGKPGNTSRTPLRSTPHDFPIDLAQPGKPGNEEEGGKPARTPPTSSGADPGRVSPSARSGPTVSPDDVRMGIDKEVRSLTASGWTEPDAMRDALKIVRAKIRNAPALVERQAMGSRCHVCGESLDGERPDVSVLQSKPGQPLHMHAGACHDAYRCRRTAIVDGIMAAAGYPADDPSKATPDLQIALQVDSNARPLHVAVLSDRPSPTTHDIPGSDDA